MSDTVTMSKEEYDRLVQQLRDLRAPFAPDQIGKLPRVTCSACSNFRTKCDKHQKQRCKDCQAWVSTQHIHIDYVGHADVTERFLEIDPFWNWEPFALDEDGLPKLDVDDLGNPVGLWIRLTILGVTRPGYGSCPANQSDAIKVLIGDALRNAGQRFGVALAQWQKGDRDNPAAENPVADAGRRAAPARQQAADAAVVVDETWVAGFEARLANATLDNVGGFRQDVIDGMRSQRINSETANRLLATVKTRADELEKASRVLPNGLPGNKDGSVSRSQLTEEQLAANGLMTKDQVKAHNKLERDTIASPRKAERLDAVPEGEPWTAEKDQAWLGSDKSGGDPA
ncbi:hypothetical protein Aph01nite_43150 [Acrocarpospora phusangensis]|uniref:Uncharacterized protein n=1 Tax=Acrocarpospora phusangensis TaxID=1070424 RepID=A0A919QGF4_9ACTN|nr:hypothetical protein [Acrocarpospora phusangensis]GIH26005.1 hypothetical protein Aph01nite_43150 [Acrocarpospora phusangensis]